jgi:hypothetical protein
MSQCKFLMIFTDGHLTFVLFLLTGKSCIVIGFYRNVTSCL